MEKLKPSINQDFPTDIKRLNDSTLSPPNSSWSRVIPENSQIQSRFNVMPGKNVEETLHIKEYRIRNRYIEATFDRTYHSEMKRSPDHLVVTTMQVHTQKMLYAYFCHELGLPYDPYGSELLKIWVTSFNVRLTRLIRENANLIQTMTINSVEKLSASSYQINLTTSVTEDTQIDAMVMIYVISDELNQEMQ